MSPPEFSCPLGNQSQHPARPTARGATVGPCGAGEDSEEKENSEDRGEMGGESEWRLNGVTVAHEGSMLYLGVCHG